MQTAQDAYLQSIDLAAEAEKIGVDAGFLRTSFCPSNIGSPFPLLAAIGAKTSKIEIGTQDLSICAMKTLIIWQKMPD